MSKHTDGPWTTDGFDVENDYEPVHVYIHAGQKIIASAIYGRTNDERRANAQLIAAAPDLLVALSKLERWSSCFIEDSPISAETLWREFPAAIKSARVALNKAEGKSGD